MNMNNIYLMFLSGNERTRSNGEEGGDGRLPVMCRARARTAAGGGYTSAGEQENQRRPPHQRRRLRRIHPRLRQGGSFKFKDIEI